MEFESFQRDKSFLHHKSITKLEFDALKLYLNEGIKNNVLSSLLSFLLNEICDSHRAIILSLEEENNSEFEYEELSRINLLVGESLGTLLKQNEEGKTVISVYDRDRVGSIHSGARYHQTREGGSIHTDNVNVPSPWDFLCFSCISPAFTGGESIIVDGIKIYEELKVNYPDALILLEKPFLWEMRGVSESLYEAPIITYNDKGEPLFRHLRPYMESAHQKANVPLTGEQLYALDVFDALLNSSKFQVRYKMRKGDVLITKDSQVLHGRTSFSDHLNAISIEEYKKDKGHVLKRTMERLWIRK